MKEPLLLLPTRLELEAVIGGTGNRGYTVGIGPAAAAMMSYHWASQEKPSMVVLLGVAGAYEGRGLKPGDVVCGLSDCFADLGYWEGGVPQTLEDMALPMLQTGDEEWGTRFDLQPIWDLPALPMITVSSMSTSHERAAANQLKFGAATESMEGAAVAMVCRFLDLPFAQVRAVSNMVGPRERSSWKMQEALLQLRNLVERHL
ncbi:MAG: futalosine hydrolase [Acidobacteria bacterium]|nr:futalosine hydrolase [Acidobacteriota bacterium]